MIYKYFSPEKRALIKASTVAMRQHTLPHSLYDTKCVTTITPKAQRDNIPFDSTVEILNERNL